VFAFFTNQLRHEGVGLDEAIRRAGEVRAPPRQLAGAVSPLRSSSGPTSASRPRKAR
jgi:hypothetical protein